MFSKLATVLLCFLLTGCVSSLHPLSSPTQALPDPKLIGLWHCADNGKPVVFEVTAGKHWMHFLDRSPNAGNAVGETDNYGFCTAIGDDRFLNVKQLGSKGSPDTYALYRYEIDDDELTVWSLDHDEVQNAIEKGKLAGKYDPKWRTKKVAQDVLITAPTDDLVKFFEHSDLDDFFTNKQVLHRVPMPR